MSEEKSVWLSADYRGCWVAVGARRVVDLRVCWGGGRCTFVWTKAQASAMHRCVGSHVWGLGSRSSFQPRVINFGMHWRGRVLRRVWPGGRCHSAG
eukprot:1738389-Rhodomonas_salina.1